MRISGFTTIRPNQAETRTYEDFMHFLGGLFAQLKPCELRKPRQSYFNFWGIRREALI